MSAIEVVVSPAQLDFPDTYVGYPSTLAMTLFNPSRNRVTVLLPVMAPFTAASSVELNGSQTVDVEVAFVPQEAGEFAVSVNMGSSIVRLRGNGLTTPRCEGSVCSASTFDATLGACVSRPANEGADCTQTSSCFLAASCHDGECLGEATTCDDTNPCTLEVCGSGGACGHIDALAICPAGADPCQAAVCDPARGCSLAPVVDGTPCGPRTCTSALVCISGACVGRVPPQTQVCVEVLAGVPAGAGKSDGPAAFARFERDWENSDITSDLAGNWYVLDGSSSRDASTLIRKIDASGTVTTLATVSDGVRHLVFDGTFLIARQKCGLLRVTLAGVVSSWVGTGTCGAANGTSRDGIGNAAEVSEGFGPMAVDPSQRTLLFVEDTGPVSVVFREVRLSTGEVTTLRPMAKRAVSSLAIADDGRIFGCVEDATNTSFGLSQLYRDGSTQTLPWPCGHALAASGNVLVLADSDSSLLTIDHGRQTSSAGHFDDGQRYADGPGPAASFGYIGGVAMNGSRVAVFDTFNHDVRLFVGGQVSTLAGAQPARGYVDGPGPTARLRAPWGIGSVAASVDGTVFFIDDTLRAISSGGLVSSLSPGSDLGRFRSVSVNGTRPWLDLGASDGGTWVGTLGADGGRGTSLSVSTTSVLVQRADGGLVALDLSQGVIVELETATVLDAGAPLGRLEQSGVCHDGRDGWYVYSSYPSSQLFHLDGSGQKTVIAPRGTGQDGALPFASIVGNPMVGIPGNLMAADGAGGLWFIDDRTKVRHYSLATNSITTKFELSDQAGALARENTGSLVLMVDSAILRLRVSP